MNPLKEGCSNLDLQARSSLWHWAHGVPYEPLSCAQYQVLRVVQGLIPTCRARWQQCSPRASILAGIARDGEGSRALIPTHGAQGPWFQHSGPGEVAQGPRVLISACRVGQIPMTLILTCRGGMGPSPRAGGIGSHSSTWGPAKSTQGLITES